MGFVSVLKKVGVGIKKTFDAVDGLAPVVKAFTPDRVDPWVDRAFASLDDLVGIVQTAEGFGATLGLPGLQKFQMSTPIVTNLILKSDLMTGKRIADPALFRKAVEGYTQATVDLLNSLEEVPAQPEA